MCANEDAQQTDGTGRLVGPAAAGRARDDPKQRRTKQTAAARARTGERRSSTPRFASDAAHVQRTRSGSSGGAPKISSTCGRDGVRGESGFDISPAKRNRRGGSRARPISSTAAPTPSGAVTSGVFAPLETARTESDDATTAGQLAGVARNACSAWKMTVRRVRVRRLHQYQVTGGRREERVQRLSSR